MGAGRHTRRFGARRVVQGMAWRPGRGVPCPYGTGVRKVLWSSSMSYRFNPDLAHRQSIRLDDHDYARGAMVLVTICTHQREALFGRAVNGCV